MSRVGKKPIKIADNIKITYKNRLLTVQGKKGTLTRTIHPAIDLKIENQIVSVAMLNDDRSSRALQGLTRSLIANMVIGVKDGFERILEINGTKKRVTICVRCLKSLHKV